MLWDKLWLRKLIAVLGFLMLVLLSFVPLKSLMLANFFHLDQINLEHVDITVNEKISLRMYRPTRIIAKLPLIMMIPGFSSSSKYIETMSMILAQKGYIVASYDFLGHGLSEGSFKITETLLESLVAQSKQILVHILEKYSMFINRDKIGVVGHSLGGNVALLLGLLNPNLIKSVVMLGGLEVSLPEEFRGNETIPRNVLLVFGSYDQLITVESAKKHFGYLFPTSNSQVRVGVEYGDKKLGNARKFVTVASDHILLPLHPDVHQEVITWMRGIFQGNQNSTSFTIRSLLLLFFYQIFLGIQGFLSLFLIILLAFIIIFLLQEKLLVTKGLIAEDVQKKDDAGRKIFFYGFHQSFFYLFLVELFSFVLGLIFGYKLFSCLVFRGISFVHLSLPSIFWSLISSMYLFFFSWHSNFYEKNNGYFEINLKKIKKDLTSLIRSIFREDLVLSILSISIILSLMLVVVSFLPFVNVSMIVIDLNIRSFERFLSFIFVFSSAFIHFCLLHFVISDGKASTQKLNKLSSVLLIQVIVVVPLFFLGLITAFIPSSLLSAIFKAGTLFIIATVLFSLILSGLLAILFGVLMKPFLSFSSVMNLGKTWHQMKLLVFAMIYGLMISTFYPVLG